MKGSKGEAETSGVKSILSWPDKRGDSDFPIPTYAVVAAEARRGSKPESGVLRSARRKITVMDTGGEPHTISENRNGRTRHVRAHIASRSIDVIRDTTIHAVTRVRSRTRISLVDTRINVRGGRL